MSDFGIGPKDEAEIRRRAELIRLAGLRARANGRIAPSLDEMTEALGDEAGVSHSSRRDAARAQRRFSVKRKTVRRR